MTSSSQGNSSPESSSLSSTSSSPNTDSPVHLPSDPSSTLHDDIPHNVLGSENLSSDGNLFQPLYPGAEITLCGAMCAIMQFCSQNRLSYTAIGQLLQLLHVLCPPSQLPLSFYLFKKFFEAFSQDHTHEKVCLKCQQSDLKYHQKIQLIWFIWKFGNHWRLSSLVSSIS